MPQKRADLINIAAAACYSFRPSQSTRCRRRPRMQQLTITAVAIPFHNMAGRGTWQQRKYLNDLPVRRHCILQVPGYSTTPSSVNRPPNHRNVSHFGRYRMIAPLQFILISEEGEFPPLLKRHISHSSHLAVPTSHLQATGIDPGTTRYDRGAFLRISF
jgi:hypothetical protein